MSFCQVILYQKHVDTIPVDIKTRGIPGEPGYEVYYDKSNSNINPDWWNDEVVEHFRNNPKDLIPIPPTDPGE